MVHIMRVNMISGFPRSVLFVPVDTVCCVYRKTMLGIAAQEAAKGRIKKLTMKQVGSRFPLMGLVLAILFSSQPCKSVNYAFCMSHAFFLPMNLW